MKSDDEGDEGMSFFLATNWEVSHRRVNYTIVDNSVSTIPCSFDLLCLSAFYFHDLSPSATH